MKRQLTTLADQTFDLLIIGGGIFGAGVARDASLRGLRARLYINADGPWGERVALSPTKGVHLLVRLLTKDQEYLAKWRKALP